MRYGIFSDVHANLEALSAVLEAYRSESIDAYICAGDVVGYAVNPNECIEKITALTALPVAGNHDWASIDLFPADNFNEVARQALFWTKGYLNEYSRRFLESLKPVYRNEDLTVVHGTLHNPREFYYMIDDYDAGRSFSVLDTGVCFLGHTHVPGAFIRDITDTVYYRQESSLVIKKHDRYIINVGSVGQPRDGNPDAAYCIYDTDKKEVQIRRVSYDVAAVRKKIIDAGLPEFLGGRLLAGR